MLNIIRRLFKQFDKDQSGYLTESEIPFILTETYRSLGNHNYKSSEEDVKSYMRMVDKNNDGKVTLEEFEKMVLESLKKSGIEIYE